MYKKDLTKDFRLRMTERDFDFLTSLAEERGVTVSQCLRSIVDEYRRSLETLNALNEAIRIANSREKEMSNGDTKSTINNKL